MKRSILQPAVIVAVAVLPCIADDPLDISWFTIDGGGVTHSASDDGRFKLSGTIGQPDAGVMTGGDFKLTGGFWFETSLGDCNESGIMDLGDHAGFIACLTGPDVQVPDECKCFDVDLSGTVDLADFAENQIGFLGE